ncbi:hypothetical protein STRIP9103_09471 [Streptomyces ipomoeae 91-03]|uniref:Uncharacterized protein n=1 Tax=Streptomyces ipomoeae 91-03 TaxID=698759 RepID=L1KHZ6_9ACTN|nr:hypothetical protein STRIP9103_09471 [Streptomyces ipomoeae 91-03]
MTVILPATTDNGPKTLAAYGLRRSVVVRHHRCPPRHVRPFSGAQPADIGAALRLGRQVVLGQVGVRLERAAPLR